MRIFTKKTDNRGTVAIETLIAFVGLLILMVFLSMWINVAALQVRVHQALTRTAQEVSFYTHALQMVGAIDALRSLDAAAAPRRQEIEDLSGRMMGTWNNLMDAGNAVTNPDADFGRLSEAINQAEGNAEGAWDILSGWGDEFNNNPAAFIQGFMWVGTQYAVDAAISAFVNHVMAPSFFWRYLDGGRPPDLTYRVAGLSASDIYFRSSFLAGPNADQIILSAQYTIDLGRVFGVTNLVNLPELRIGQQVKTRAWVGDGRSFDDDISGIPAQRGDPQ